MAESPFHLSLSAKGLQKLETPSHEKDFMFIVGDLRYACPSFVAEFLSPRITALRSQDITIAEFSITTEDPEHCFEILMSIGFGHEVCLSPPQIRFFRRIAGELRNSELFELTLKREGGQITEEELKARLDFLSGIDENLPCEVELISSHFSELSVSDFDQLSSSVLEAILSDSSLVVWDEDSIFEVIRRRASADLSYFRLLEFVRFEFLSVECMGRAFEFISSSFDSLSLGVWSSLRNRLTLPVTPLSQTGRLCPPAVDSKIISAVPQIFCALRGQALRLLYRGSRDGFEASAFHGRCDGHPNTITLICSTTGCIFGGYTPLAWNSRNGYVPDPSEKTFIFTLKNPHNLPARIYKLKDAQYAINDQAQYGPTFGCNAVYVCDKCQSSTSSYSNVNIHYVNDTGIQGLQVLTGAKNFTVKEIEVFEVISRV
jgi:hypothetical protein